MAHGDKVIVEFGPESMRVLKGISRDLHALAKPSTVINLPGQPDPVPTDDVVLNGEVIRFERERIIRALTENTTLSPNEIRRAVDG